MYAEIQIDQRSISVGEAVAQRIADFFHRHALRGEFLGLERLAGADRAMRAMRIAIAVEQILMPVGAVASALAMQLREQRGIALGDLVGLLDFAHELVGIERQAQILRRRPGIAALLRC